jgi:hypothetical protein
METTGPVNGKLTVALRQCAAAKFSGVLRVDGQPGGTIYLTGGRISACQTPGAPGLEVILLRSGRIPEPGWEAAFTAAAVAKRPMTAELIERELLGAGEAEALLRTALADAMFALVSGHVDGWTEAMPADCLLPLIPAARSGWLIAEATRRRQVLASFTGPAVTAQDRVAATPGETRPGRAPGQRQDEILALADGRRTARDLAFVLGRGLYETMLQLARLRAANLLVLSSAGHEVRHEAGREAPHEAGHEAGRRRGRNLTAIRMLRPRAEGS